MDIWTVLMLALLPGLGNFAGGMLAELSGASPRMLNISLHAASGIVIGIVAVELLPEALDGLAGWWIAVAVAAGGVAYVLIEAGVERLQGRKGGSAGRISMWMIYVAVAVDLTADGLMLGSGTAVSLALGISLAAGQVLADVPEGFATVANLRKNGVSGKRRIMLSASFILYCVGAALLAYLLLRGAPERAKLAALAFAAGLLSVAAIEDMLEEAHKAREDTRGSVLAFIGGFALFVLVSAGFETALGKGSGKQAQARDVDSSSFADRYPALGPNRIKPAPQQADERDAYFPKVRPNQYAPPRSPICCPCPPDRAQPLWAAGDL